MEIFVNEVSEVSVCEEVKTLDPKKRTTIGTSQVTVVRKLSYSSTLPISSFDDDSITADR